MKRRTNPKKGEADLAKEMIYDPAIAIAIVEKAKADGIQAAELNEEQQTALYLLAGYLEVDEKTGTLVSKRPVRITDRGDGGYCVIIDPKKLTLRERWNRFTAGFSRFVEECNHAN